MLATSSEGSCRSYFPANSRQLRDGLSVVAATVAAALLMGLSVDIVAVAVARGGVWVDNCSDWRWNYSVVAVDDC